MLSVVFEVREPEEMRDDLGEDLEVVDSSSGSSGISGKLSEALLLRGWAAEFLADFLC